MADGNVAVATWLQRLAPDVATTVKRFPFAIVLAACATIAFIASINVNEWLDGESWFRLFVGLATAAVFAVAGVFFAESRPQSKRTALLLSYLAPVAVAGIAQIRDAGWAVPFLLPMVAILWLSVSASTEIGRGQEREQQQHRFWWLNHRAIATAGLAAIGFGVIAIGVLAIERSLNYLFGFTYGEVFYRWVLPFTGLFLTPVYWLATLPRLDDYNRDELEKPEFIASAVGFLGQFVLAPFLVIYAAILLVYTGQIAITRTLPEGTIGWMVLGFVVAGAGTWLVLHPPFMRKKPLVRLFRTWWFWLTLIPLAVFFFAVWIRVDAYGLTSERLILLAGGVWAALVSAVFLIGRGDIRLIPALAGVILLALSLGPWNYLAWPDHDQGGCLSRLLADVKDPTATAGGPDWDTAEAAEARSAMDYLMISEHGRKKLVRVLLDHGFVYDPASVYAETVMADLGYPGTASEYEQAVYVPRMPGRTVNISMTPNYIGHQEAYPYEIDPKVLGWQVVLKDGSLVVAIDGVQVLSQDLAPWAAKQGADYLTEPWIDFVIAEATYRLVLTSASWWQREDRREVSSVSGVLFSDDPTVSIPRP